MANDCDRQRAQTCTTLGALDEGRHATRRGRKLQVALDTRDIASALRALRQVAEHVDVIEVGTILCLSEGMRAVREIRACYPDHVVLADIRIAEAGALLAPLAFDAGADWVTVVSGAAPDVFEAVVHAARERGGDVQVELSDGWTWDLVGRCRELGIRHFILHRSRDAEARGELIWGDGDLAAVRRLHADGGRVTVTGGMTVTEVATFTEQPVEIFIAGRALYAAEEPGRSAAAFSAAVRALPPLSPA